MIISRLVNKIVTKTKLSLILLYLTSEQGGGYFNIALNLKTFTPYVNCQQLAGYKHGLIDAGNGWVNPDLKKRMPCSWFHCMTRDRSLQLARQSSPRYGSPLASNVRLIKSLQAHNPTSCSPNLMNIYKCQCASW